VRPIDRSLLQIFAGEQAEHVGRVRSLLANVATPEGGADATALDELQRRAHTLKGAAHAVGLEMTETVIHRLETVFSKFRDGSARPTPDAIMLVERCMAAVEDILAAAQADTDPPSVEDLLAALEHFPATAPAPARRAPAPAKSDTPAVQPPAEGDFVRVNARYIDEMVGVSAELLGAAVLDVEQDNPFLENARLLDQVYEEWQQMRRGDRPGSDADEALQLRRARHCLEFIDRQISSLRRRAHAASDVWDVRARDFRRRAEDVYEHACNVRLTPAETVFSGFGALVRELAYQENKPIEFRTQGLETQADRLVLQALKDPVMHLLRNAVSHGAEPEEARIRKGKPPVNTIEIRISARGERLQLSVADDGRGIDTGAIVQEALRRGFLSDASEATPANVTKLILLPGLSTAKEVTNLAGRGLGLSIVQEAVTRLQGDISIRPLRGGGTAISISVPLAASTQHILFAETAGQIFGISTSFVDQLLRVDVSEIRLVEGRESVIVGAEAVRLVRLSDVLGLPLAAPQDDERGPEKLLIVVASANEERIALVVGALRDEREVIVKDSGLAASQAGFTSGAVSMDDGSVAVVLNVPELLAQAGRRKTSASFVVLEPEQKVSSILVVDDSLTTRSLEKTILEAHGYRVRIAVDGAQALELLRAEPADLVISDVLMPRMTGFQLLAAMKGDATLKAIPVILVTSLESREEQAQGLELGADAYIVKHKFDQRELLQIVRQLI
jgi:two-component system chemotaxis sensor kinase CheA